jgi:hypothetical protein
MTNKFKIGDKVRFHQKTICPESYGQCCEAMPDKTGYVKHIFERPIGDDINVGKDNIIGTEKGWSFSPQDLTLVTEPEFKVIPEYILCSTPELARQVLEKIEMESDLRWRGGEMPSNVLPKFYPSLIITEYKDIISVGINSYFRDKKYTPAEEYLGIVKEEQEVKETVEEYSKKTNDFNKFYSFITPQWQQTNWTTTNKTKPKGKKLMENILEFAKNISLSKDEKELREAGLHDDNGNWTNPAMCIVEDKMAQKLGYKDDDDMGKKLGTDGYAEITYSPAEYHAMFTEFADDLQKIANKFVASKKK